MKILSYYLLSLSLLILTSCHKDDPFPDEDHSVLSRKVDEFKSKHKVASISAALVTGDELSWQYQSGLSNKEENIGIQKESIYKLGSVSKPITGLLLLKLVEQGKINLDQDINSYLPFPVRNPNFPNDKITLRQIMTHTSGITDTIYNEKLLSDFSSIGEDHPMKLKNFVHEMLATDGHYYHPKTFSKNKPGTLYNYSNVAVALAGSIIEEISGQSFEDFSKQYITSPLQMHETLWKISQVPSKLFAYPYGPQGENYGLYALVDLPSGGLHSSVGDLARVMSLIINEGKYQGKTLFDQVSIQEMRRIQFPFAEDPELKNQGLLLEHTNIGRHQLIGHNGKVPGSNTFMWIDNKEKRGVMIMINSDIISATMMKDVINLIEQILDTK
ncbi:penicillin-binding protein [Chryseobacterium sp. StRB126]|uniref:serine hydrolase domain-containing protein n=1 Tax=Chryseobacterium sp. StRB126 TaxID=878220 RepID=UPI0004E99442|nr:serine hydrolase domain-containing protein [Chryseobacterium sp. StRB126]BAP32309.1 penicillin-binding protein [Chryseobacterium sp. StRB126]